MLAVPLVGVLPPAAGPPLHTTAMVVHMPSATAAAMSRTASSGSQSSNAASCERFSKRTPQECLFVRCCRQPSAEPNHPRIVGEHDEKAAGNSVRQPR